MNVSIGKVLAVCLVVSFGSFAIAQSAGRADGGRPCSNRTLSGDYGAQIEGTIYIPNDPNPPIKVDLRTISMGHYDGTGNVTSTDHVVVNGMPPAEEWRVASGTYSVNPDCTGTFSIFTGEGNPPIVVYFVVVNGGKEIRGVVNGSAITFDAYRVN